TFINGSIKAFRQCTGKVFGVHICSPRTSSIHRYLSGWSCNLLFFYYREREACHREALKPEEAEFWKQSNKSEHFWME
ncbi:hypothetical protein, partial [Candidatus Pyrohabitans sp.]